jgi:Leucine-rich repeat (LRR) protein
MENNPISSKLKVEELNSCMNVKLASSSTTLNLTEVKLAEIAGTHLKDEEFELEEMDIEFIDPNTFNKVTSTLLRLDLSYNKLTQINKQVFAKLKKLKYLNLANNKLESIDQNLFDGLESLEFLKLKQCGLVSLQPNTFSKLTKLHELDLSNLLLIIHLFEIIDSYYFQRYELFYKI